MAGGLAVTSHRPAGPRARDGVRLAALAYVLAARVGLWLLPLPALRRALAWGPPRAGRGPGASAEEVGAAVRAARRAVPRATCLVEALAAEAMLRRRGLPAEVHLAVSAAPGAGAAGHAWVASRGAVVVGEGPGAHAPLGTLPRP